METVGSLSARRMSYRRRLRGVDIRGGEDGAEQAPCIKVEITPKYQCRKRRPSSMASADRLPTCY